MNYLGHLYFSNDDPELMLANLYGDFVKGRDLSAYPAIVQQGIGLHRKIDSYIDSHPAVLELLHSLYPELPKIAGVAVDLYFDHLLAREWSSYHPDPLSAFLQRFYDAVDFGSKGYSETFRQLIRKLVDMDWISKYQTLEGLDRACRGVSSRISFPNELKHGRAVFEANEKKISTTFAIYMSDAVDYFNSHYSK
jgi:acyl carrier protein phosphodiesterase